MQREEAITDLVQREAAARGYDQSMVLLGEAVALRLYARGESAYRSVQHALDEAARMPEFRPGGSFAAH